MLITEISSPFYEHKTPPKKRRFFFALKKLLDKKQKYCINKSENFIIKNYKL